MKILIAPSILSADFGKLNEEIASVEAFVEMLHVDVMDGHFVPNITIGAPVVKCIKTKLPLDCHLMIENPEKYVEDFAKAGAASITVHAEACKDLEAIVAKIKDLGVKAAVSINPETPVEKILPVLGDVDMVLVMSVNPGFGGQKFIESALPKIAEIRKLKPNLDIEVDGGINAETAKLCIKAGANILVAGSYIFGAEDRKKAVESLR
jgi:ribulose-phosphate 3-epimerase